MTEPSQWLRSVSGHYPDVNHFEATSQLTKADYKRFAALWLLEGIPFAFTAWPGVYQSAREQCARELSVSFRDIGLTGSARLGYSLKPNQFGKVFDSTKSDIDLFLVSRRWFGAVSEQAKKFVRDLDEGVISPRNANEEKFWPFNASKVGEKISRGYIDPDSIPSWKRYPAIVQVNEAAFRFHYNLRIWSGSEIAKKASIRIYENWEVALDGISFNVKSAVKYKDQ